MKFSLDEAKEKFEGKFIRVVWKQYDGSLTETNVYVRNLKPSYDNKNVIFVMVTERGKEDFKLYDKEIVEIKRCFNLSKDTKDAIKKYVKLSDELIILRKKVDELSNETYQARLAIEKTTSFMPKNEMEQYIKSKISIRLNGMADNTPYVSVSYGNETTINVCLTADLTGRWAQNTRSYIYPEYDGTSHIDHNDDYKKEVESLVRKNSYPIDYMKKLGFKYESAGIGLEDKGILSFYMSFTLHIPSQKTEDIKKTI